MNLSAIVIIMAISCAGSPIALNGESSLSIPSVRLSGLVQSVSMEEPIISRISRIAIKTAVRMPSLVILRIHQLQMTSPLIMKILSAKVKSKIISIGLRPLRIKPSGTPDTAISTASTTAEIAKPIKSFTIKSSIMNSNVAIIFTLGSSLCTQDSPG